MSEKLGHYLQENKIFVVGCSSRERKEREVKEMSIGNEISGMLKFICIDPLYQ